MKKVFMIVTMVFALCVSAFADKSRFYENGKVIDTMYVGAGAGLRVRDKPSLKANKVCSLQYRMPVKVVAIGKEETIDGITAPWVEILIPRYEWKGFEPEYGWVFGGYLEKNQKAFSTKGWTNADFKSFLSKCEWIIDKDEPNPRILIFGKDGSFKLQYEEMGAGGFGSWSADFSQKKVTTVSSFYFAGDDDCGPPETTTNILNISEIEEFSIVVNNERFISRGNFGIIANEEDFRQTERNSSSFNSYIKSCLTAFYFSSSRFDYSYRKSTKFKDKYIRFGICNPNDEEYMASFHSYWNPIMSEHQKKADEMK